ncbi:MAG: hypothetical protein KJ721_00305 [Nanoarchaeota archaeon]|nr:hypothetical protein [Nanoarchaeota archaeon]
MNENNEEDVVFAVRVEDLQGEAVQRIGRELTEEELYKASKGIEFGLSFDINTVFETAIEEAVV